MCTDLKHGGRSQLLCWSANSADQLNKTIETFFQADALQRFSLEDIAFTLQQGRRDLPVRWSRVFGPADSLETGLEEIVPVTAANLDLVWVFAGQGSQYSGMLADIYHYCELVRERVDRCCSHLHKCSGIDLKPLLLTPASTADDPLQKTELAQPALFILSVAQASLWQKLGLEPSVAFGHSLGEYCAAWLAGVWSLEAAVELVHRRGQLMAGAEPGAMLACQASEKDLHQLPDVVLDQFDIAAVNSKEQVVISVSLPRLPAVVEALEKSSIRYRQLKTSHAFHSRMMEPLLDEFRELVNVSSPQAPSFQWFSNLTGELISENQATDPDYWCRHLRQPVQFKRCAERALASVANPLLLEIGPGQNMASLLTEQCGLLVSTCRGCHSEKQYDDWLGALGSLWERGVVIDWFGLPLQRQAGRVPLPGTALKPVRCWVDVDAQSVAQTTQNQTQTAETASKQLPVNQRLKSVWCKVLGVSDINDDDDFFALGGNSIHMVEMARLANSQGLVFSVAQAYAHPELKQLCQLIESSSEQNTSEQNTAEDSAFEPETPFQFCQLSDAEFDLLLMQIDKQGGKHAHTQA